MAKNKALRFTAILAVIFTAIMVNERYAITEEEREIKRQKDVSSY